MQLTIPAPLLRRPLEACAEIADKSGKRPVYAATRIDVEDGAIVCSATNSRESVVLRESGEIDAMSNGSVFLPSENLLRIVKAAKKESLTITWPESKPQAKLNYGSTWMKLPVEPPKNLPPIIGFNENLPSFRMPAAALTSLFQRAVVSIQTDFTNRALHGVCLRTQDDTVFMAATDGRRFSLVSMPVEGLDGVNVDILVPPPSMSRLRRLYDESDDAHIEIQASSARVCMRGPKGELSWRLIDGRFPDYEGHIPLVSAREMTLDRRALIDLLEQHAVIKTAGGMKHKLTFDDGRVRMDSSAGIDGAVSVSAEVPWEWEEIVVYLDPALVVDGLKVMRSKEVVMGIDSAQLPVLFKEVGTEHDYRYMVVPMSER